MSTEAPPRTPSVEKLLSGMEVWQASDLFLCEGKAPAVRIHGTVVELDAPATTRLDIEQYLDHALSAPQRERFFATGDLDVGTSLDGGRRFRLNLSRQQGALALTARALPPGDLRLEDLGLPAAVADLADLVRGLVLVTGATGSGKSTTLAAVIHRINTTRRLHVVTVEDPIEYVHRDGTCRISQREVGSDTASFAAALRHVVRQSPDVILIGELRDLDTMQVAISAALTGHLVLASLHTLDATQTLQRILSFFPIHLREQVALDLSLSLEGIVSQRLVPTADGAGRAVATELLRVTPPVARLIREQRVEEVVDLLRGSTDPSISSFNHSLLRLYQEDKITYEVARASSSNPDELALAVQGMSTGVEAFRDRRVPLAIAGGLDMKALLRVVEEVGASDLHLAVGRPPIVRVAGALEPLEVDPLTPADLRRLLFSIISQRQRTTYELERELDFALALESGERFRVNAYYQKGSMAASLRAIPSRVPDAAALRLPTVLLELGARPHGLLLVVGPTGSGKTTTLACLVARINESRPCRVITVEDPIEYTHESVLATVDQREVHADTQSFSAALKYVLRQDPDVIMIGEMRDLETVGAALTAAETGHLVLATLHTNDAVQSVDRIVDVFPPHQQSQARSQLAACLIGVVSQRLLARRDGHGRTPAFEVMVATPAIRTCIRDSKMHQALSLMETARADGMITMDRALADLLFDGVVMYEDALRYVRNPRSLGPRPGEETEPL
jgi:twitching motility protein PilT